MDAPALRLTEVTKVFDGAARPAVDRISMSVDADELVSFVGPSGCGKTTTLRMINRLVEPSAGEILVVQNGVWLTAAILDDRGALARSIERCEQIALALPPPPRTRPSRIRTTP